jgi:methylated-DNA-[protein]-cysteine S-methyltransferase
MIKEEHMNTYYSFWRGPIGQVLLISDGEALTGVYLENQKYYPAIEKTWKEKDDLAIFHSAKEQLSGYFEGNRTEFDLEYRLVGTDFQREVWGQLSKIPFGETISYRELAGQIGRPKAVRAVGQANGRNPISIMIPCHRVVGMNGSLTGYGGGLTRKEFLLKHESAR